jgi:hypothetical protein
LPLNAKVHDLVLLPPLEHAPDQMASRPLLIVNVIDVPVANDADPVLPTATLMPAGLDVTRSPLRPVAVTVNVAACEAAAGVTVNVVVLLTAPEVAVMVTDAFAATVEVVAAKVALVAPAGMVTLAGTVATAVLLLESDTAAPPVGAPAVSVTVPVDPFPPTTLAGLTETADKAGAEVVACGVKRRVDENGPKTPAALRARTRHHRVFAGSPKSVACETVAAGLATNGAAMVDELSTCTS